MSPPTWCCSAAPILAATILWGVTDAVRGGPVVVDGSRNVKAGDWAAYGTYIKQLGDILDRLAAASQVTTPTVK